MNLVELLGIVLFVFLLFLDVFVPFFYHVIKIFDLRMYPLKLKEKFPPLHVALTIYQIEPILMLKLVT